MFQEKAIIEDPKYWVVNEANPALIPRQPWNEDHLRVMRRLRIRRLGLSHLRGSDDTDLSFLYELPELEELRIVGKTRDCTPVSSLIALKRLHMSCSATSKVHVAHLPLEKLSLEDVTAVADIGECRKLKRLFLYEWKQLPDLKYFKNMKDLRILQLSLCRIESLAGLKDLPKLRMLEVCYSRKLRSIAELADGAGLDQVRITNCKNVEDFAPLSSCKNLRYLDLSDNGKVPTLRFLLHCRELRSLNFAGTDVLDGDVACLAELPNLFNINFVDRKSYNMKNEEFAASGNPVTGEGVSMMANYLRG